MQPSCGMNEPLASTADLAVIGAGVAGCALAATLRQRGWHGSIRLLEIGRGPGGRTATRRSRSDRATAINHGAPLFNITGQPEPALLAALREGGWIRPYDGAIHALNGQGQLSAAEGDPLCSGALWQGHPQMDALSRGLLALSTTSGCTTLQTSTLVQQLTPLPGGHGWLLHGSDGTPLLRCRWLVLSGTLLAHPRCQTVFGWKNVPLQQATADLRDPSLLEAAAALAATTSLASSNLLIQLAPEVAGAWQWQPWRLLQFNAEAQQRWGIRRVSLQNLAPGRMALVVESSAHFAAQHWHVYGSRSAAARLLGAKAEAEEEVMAALEHALQAALGLSTAGGQRQLMRWGAAFPLAPGLDRRLSLCPESRIGFCGDAIAGLGFGRVEGALRSAEHLAEQLLPRLINS